MCQQALHTILGRVILDEAFRLDLFADPALTLAEYDLTESEILALKSVDAESLDTCADWLGHRIIETQRIASSMPEAHESPLPRSDKGG